MLRLSPPNWAKRGFVCGKKTKKQLRWKNPAVCLPFFLPFFFFLFASLEFPTCDGEEVPRCVSASPVARILSVMRNHRPLQIKDKHFFFLCDGREHSVPFLWNHLTSAPPAEENWAASKTTYSFFKKRNWRWLFAVLERVSALSGAFGNNKSRRGGCRKSTRWASRKAAGGWSIISLSRIFGLGWPDHAAVQPPPWQKNPENPLRMEQLVTCCISS